MSNASNVHVSNGGPVKQVMPLMRVYTGGNASNGGNGSNVSNGHTYQIYYTEAAELERRGQEREREALNVSKAGCSTFIRMDICLTSSIIKWDTTFEACKHT